MMTLIETGTYKGEMIEATKNIFDRIVSIEIDRELYLNATKKFAENPKIKIIEGDSGIVLSSVLRSIGDDCLFWLDGHYSGAGTSKSDINTPIIKELTCIFENYPGRYVILIDDARCFDGTSDYPDINLIKKMAMERNLKFDVKTDIIRIYHSN